MLKRVRKNQKFYILSCETRQPFYGSHENLYGTYIYIYIYIYIYRFIYIYTYIYKCIYRLENNSCINMLIGVILNTKCVCQLELSNVLYYIYVSDSDPTSTSVRNSMRTVSGTVTYLLASSTLVTEMVALLIR